MKSEIVVCFNQMIEGTFTKQCFMLTLAKLLGCIIFVLSFTLKIPQIILILKKKSIKGLSAMSVYVDFISTNLQGLYCYHKGLPISIYGEYISIVLQNFTILLLFWHYSNNNVRNKQNIHTFYRLIFLLLIGILYFMCLFKGNYIPKYIWDIMASSNIPFVLVSRVTQIAAIMRSKDASSVSSSSYLMRFLKNFIKAISLLLETDTYILLVNQIFNGLTSMSVVFLILIYGGKEKIKNE